MELTIDELQVSIKWGIMSQPGAMWNRAQTMVIFIFECLYHWGALPLPLLWVETNFFLLCAYPWHPQTVAEVANSFPEKSDTVASAGSDPEEVNCPKMFQITIKERLKCL